MGTVIVNTAPIPVISVNSLLRGVQKMTQQQFEMEKNYRLALTIAKTMLNNDLISPKEYKKIDAMLIAKYQPIIASLRV